jgi:2-amino-4-hydroxy-6-hydroxymethyldihydropteridine diphosphokinase
VPRVYLGVGSNLGDRLAALQETVRRLHAMADVTVVTASRLYESEPWETEPGHTAGEQRWYLNGVLILDTALPPRTLLQRLQSVEQALGRTRPAGATPEEQRFAPHAIDIDILFYGDEVISTPDDLHIPHLLLAERAFVLRPLADVAPDLVHPTLYQTVREMLDDLADAHDVRPGDYPGDWASR